MWQGFLPSLTDPIGIRLRVLTIDTYKKAPGMTVMIPDEPTTERDYDMFSRRMKRDLQFRFAMITARALELGEEPPTELCDTTIYDPEEHARLREQEFIANHYESLRHEQTCRDLGYDPMETTPERLGDFIATVNMASRYSADLAGQVLHPVDLRALEREEEIAFANSLDDDC